MTLDELIDERIRQFTEKEQRLGATFVPGEGVYFRIWAPEARTVEIVWQGHPPVVLERQEQGYYTGFFPEISKGTDYHVLLDGKKLADPASRWQPEGVFGPSRVFHDSYEWMDDGWQGSDFTEWVIYEIHPGTYSLTGDFAGIIEDLPRLRDLGVTTIELTPVAQFSGAHNWGYDGVFPFAVQHSYGGPAALKRLVDAAHAHGLSIILDVVYNHIGPEGNILFDCGPYNQPGMQQPWGEMLNFDGEQSEHVRRYFLQNVWQWLTEFHFDGLRLDAVPNIVDTSAIKVVQEMTALAARASKQLGRPLIMIAESNLNDPMTVTPVRENGLGFHAQWSDDFQHTVHHLLTGEDFGYYGDFTGGVEQLARIYREGTAFAGEVTPKGQRRYGRSYEGVDFKKLIIELQNHDQVGNRLDGARYTHLMDAPRQRLAAAAMLLAPFTPLLFMGEELRAPEPFHYFVDHTDRKLVDMAIESRHKQFGAAQGTDMADPGMRETYDLCILKDKAPAADTEGGLMQSFYRDLIGYSKKLRKSSRPFVEVQGKVVCLTYKHDDGDYLVILSFADTPASVILPEGREWTCLLDSAAYPGGSQTDVRSALAPFSARLLRAQM